MEGEDSENVRVDAEKELENRVIAEIVELQREYYFENRNKDSERKRRLREIIDRATPMGSA